MEKENKTINILLIVIMILVVVGCIVAYLYFTHAWEKKDKNQDPIFTMENYPKIDGSTAATFSVMSLRKIWECRQAVIKKCLQ